MLLKWFLFIAIFSVLDARDDQFRSDRSPTCRTLRLENGKVRGRGLRNRLIKFICMPGYQLVGNRYATCRNGEWDTPTPTCVQNGCEDPTLSNGLIVPSWSGAWMVFFCFPGYELQGSPAIYCDGEHWNDTAPMCIEDKVPPALSCDFEDEQLCGWEQDSTHDFDWTRCNKKTPSSFLFTGPSHDHTYGENRDGHYMYIESSSRAPNDTARLMSPIYDKSLAVNGCFAFYYHMFGKSTGGLRVYQSVVSRSGSEDFGQLSLLFELWGNQGNEWYGDVLKLHPYEGDFQIIIEGRRGRSFTSDIAIDDVAILQGDGCDEVKKGMVTPPSFMPESCEDRCTNSTAPQLGCSCSWICIVEKSCCADYYDVCLSDWVETTEATVESTTLPSTSKEWKTDEASTTPTSTTTIATTTTTKKTSPATIKTPPTTTTKPKTITKINATQDTLIKIETTNIEKNMTSPIMDATTIIPIKNPSPRTPRVVVKKTTVVYKPQKMTTRSNTQNRKTDSAKKFKEEALESNTEKPAQSSAWRPILISGVVLLCCGGLVWVAVASRRGPGRAALDYLRGRTRNDPEVQYLHADVDD